LRSSMLTIPWYPLESNFRVATDGQLACVKVLLKNNAAKKNIFFI
jgi:hypothetical protein